MAFLLFACLPAGARAAGTTAGTVISNTATADFFINGSPVSADSNPDIFPVDEVLDVALVANDADPVGVTSPDSNVPMSFTLTNTGNGPEAFRLTFDNLLAGDQFDPANVRIYLDDGDGLFGIGTDTLYTLDANNPLLAPDASRVVFVVGDAPAGLVLDDLGLVRLAATAQTGSGNPGTVFAGDGEGGVDAVVGMTRATDDAQNGYVVALASGSISKSQAYTGVADSGTVVTYTLVFRLTGAGTVSNVVIRDVIPALTTYVPGSLTLDSVPLTDAVDADAGSFDGTQIAVQPNGGTVDAPSIYTVTFAVTIN